MFVTYIYKIYLIFRYTIIFLLIIFSCLRVKANGIKILAYINDQVITSRDLFDRMKLMQVFIHDIDPKFRDPSNVLRLLVRENIVYQLYIETVSSSISVDSLNNIAAKYNFDSFDDMSLVLDVPRNILLKAIKNQQFERELINYYYGSQYKLFIFSIGAEFFDCYIDYLKNNLCVKINEIVISSKRSLDIEVINNLIANNISFDLIAYFYSESNSYIKGGEIGWSNFINFPDVIKKILISTPILGISLPIKITDRIIFIKLFDIYLTYTKLNFAKKVHYFLPEYEFFLFQEKFLRHLYKMFYIQVDLEGLYYYLYK